MGAMARKEGTADKDTEYSGAMPRLLSLIIRLALVAVVVGVVRAVLADRSPRRSLHGTQPVVGSIDTWPEVPRRPTD
jgi:hypothetical protein